MIPKVIVCVTGKIGTGKSTVAKIISRILGFPVIDVDKIGHQVLKMEEIKEKIREAFGDDVFEGGEVSREKLARKVFYDERNLKILESILHPHMRDIVYERVKKYGDAVIDCALLRRMGLIDVCDCVVTVVSDPKKARSRKPHLDDETFSKILEMQKDIDNVGIIIENNGSLEELERKVIEFIKKKIGM